MTTEHDDALPLDAIPWLKERSDAMTAGRAIRVYRKCEEWTLEDAASRLGISAQMLSMYERGVRLPSIEAAMKIAAVLGMSGLYLVQLVLRDQLRLAGLDCNVTLEQREAR